jgi:hypothetical protein
VAELLPDTWSSRDLPVLVEVARHFDRSTDPLNAWQVAQATGLTAEDVTKAGRALASDDLVEIEIDMDGSADFRGISGEARRLTGLWPSPEVAADRLLAALEQAIERAQTPEQRSHLQRALDGILRAGRDVAVGVAGGVLTGQVPT